MQKISLQENNKIYHFIEDDVWILFWIEMLTEICNACNAAYIMTATTHFT